MRTKERLPRKRYSPEFKMELLRLAFEQKGSVAVLARQHDVNDNLLFTGNVKDGSAIHAKTHRHFLLSFLSSFELSHRPQRKKLFQHFWLDKLNESCPLPQADKSGYLAYEK
jgi:hypothetical protein